MKIIKFLVSTILAVGLTYTLNRPWGSIPALGRFFSPFEGFLSNGESKTSLPPSDLKIEGLKDEVTVVFDDNRIPHVFANNDEDLYFAQGYLVAKDRLWQMEFYTMAAAGRLSEIVGARAVELDRHSRRLGMSATAKEIAKQLNSNPIAKSVLEAYSAGVNAYIKQVAYKDLPVEYKILGYQPEEWSPYKTILMLQNMRNTLNSGSSDYRMSNVMAKYGEDVVKELFPDYPVIESPIIPEGTKWEFTPVPVPSVPSPAVENAGVAFNLAIPEPRPEIGSNNWAVHGDKSATGLPILANDPHLQLTLPSIWYQIQLTSPNVNVYGACLPGTPGVTIGFNKDVAWGVTNTHTDIMDFYQIKFKDKSMKEYWYNGAWKPTTMRIEEISVKGMPTVKDTIFSTHHGPILYNEGQNPTDKGIPTAHAMRWIANELIATDLMTFYYLNRAKNYTDYRKALTYYVAPAQNFIFASNENDIAITPNGKFPLKWKGQGKFVLDGTNPAHDWQGWIPTEHNPTVKNPARKFVSSANQFPTDQTYPYYLGWRYASHERASQINRRLSAMEKATVDSLRSVQNDNTNLEAKRILPEIFKVLDTDPAVSKDAIYQTVRKWNMKNDADEVGATIYEEWVVALRRAIWEDDFKLEDKENKVPMLYPTNDVTWNMIKTKPNALWFDDVTTKDKQETLADMLKKSFKATSDSLTKNYGPMNAKTWAWAVVKSTDINHLVPFFKSFSRLDLHVGGGGKIVNAITRSTGPSWRMVVQLDKGWPKAYGVYPGGQSGNIGSPFYDNMVDTWAKGELNELLFMKSKDEKNPRISATMKIKP
ncbi:MAG: penicillin acylase family protein [Spirosomaceae bacterium]|nr:penicillin acylase family protein [Spirosomataceae bacterium]